jgi:hypothetical protein
MNAETFIHFSRDCSSLLKEMARDAKQRAVSCAGTVDESFRYGELMAFHAVISLLQQQARAFGIPLATLDLSDIDPERDLL